MPPTLLIVDTHYLNYILIILTSTHTHIPNNAPNITIENLLISCHLNAMGHS